MNYYAMAIKKFGVFSGRANRQEYWMFVLVNFLIYLGAGVLEGMTSGATSTLTALYALFILIPSLAIQSRRLHDINMSALWMLLYFVPFVGGIILLIMSLVKGDEESNEYGPVSTA